jgi:hypothetical protein
MATKLTLRIEETLIEHAKSYARRRGTSLSQMVSDFFALLPEDSADETRQNVVASMLPPITASLWGLLQDTDVQEEDYRRFLEEKHR